MVIPPENWGAVNLDNKCNAMVHRREEANRWFWYAYSRQRNKAIPCETYQPHLNQLIKN